MDKATFISAIKEKIDWESMPDIEDYDHPPHNQWYRRFPDSPGCRIQYQWSEPPDLYNYMYILMNGCGSPPCNNNPPQVGETQCVVFVVDSVHTEELPDDMANEALAALYPAKKGIPIEIILIIGAGVAVCAGIIYHYIKPQKV